MVKSAYYKPIAVEEALSHAAGWKGNFRFIAGGTDVMPNRQQGTEHSKCLIDLTGIEGMRGIFEQENYLRIGALMRLDELGRHEVISSKFPALVKAARSVASPLIRMTATIGGNILCENRCIFYDQSEFWRTAAGFCLKDGGDICIPTGGTKACFSRFVSDVAPVLISLDAVIEVVDEKAKNNIPLENIYTGDGLRPISLPEPAIVTAVLVPLQHSYRQVFRKLRPRKSVDFTSLTTIVSLRDDGAIIIVLGGVDPKPIVVRGTTGGDCENLIISAVKKPRIVENDFYSRSYRKEMITSFLRKSFELVGNKKK